MAKRTKMSWSEKLDRAQDRRDKKQREEYRKAIAEIAAKQVSAHAPQWSDKALPMAGKWGPK